MSGIRIPRWSFVIVVLASVSGACGQRVAILTQNHDPFGFPRPGAGHTDVPLRTSLFLELGIEKPEPADAVLPESVSITLQPDGEEPADVLTAGPRFAPGWSGRLFPTARGPERQPALAVYATPYVPLKPGTNYTIRVIARSRHGAELPARDGAWSFTTEPAPQRHEVALGLNFGAAAVRWHGGFFTGFCKPSFCTSDPALIGTYELMAEARKRSPKAWGLQRDFWMTGLEVRPEFLSPVLPNVVRERETRRIAAIEPHADGTLLRVEDFFGHEQYGIGAGRPVGDDYHPGDEVLIADGVHDVRAKVLSADDRAGTVLVSRFDAPAGGWQLKYSAPLPTKEDPNAPGLFASGGCYLIRFRPHGTPCYYWGRLDKEFDIAHRRFGRRLSPNFADAPVDLAVDGRNWTTAKDYAELHEVVRTMTGHLIDRYGDACLDFVWSVFNEPDLGALFWRTDWDELQRFYDYTTDAILRAFEDRGHDSSRVFIGGLELGGVSGTNLRLREFLAHCSPRATEKGALPRNAAFADARLDGRRSRRVEALCRAHAGRGAPCDFVSVHAYNRAEMMAAKLIRAKEIALEIDAGYYAELWVNSHESCPDWNPPPDPGAADSYLGNGYYPTWCADVARRQLARAAEDPRFAYGETILTFWPWPNDNFTGNTACTRKISVDDDGDGEADRTVLVPMPIFHFLTLLAGMNIDGGCRVLPEKRIAGNVISGFATRGEHDIRILLYAHNALDTQSRSERAFRIALDLEGIPWPRVRVTEYRFDREHNTYFRLAKELRDRPTTRPGATEKASAALRAIEDGEREAKLAALKRLADIGPAGEEAVRIVLKVLAESKDEAIRFAAFAALQRIGPSAPCYSPDDVGRIQAQSALHETGSGAQTTDPTGHLKLTADLIANGAIFVILEPDGSARPR